MGLARVFMARAPNLIAAVDIATCSGAQVRNCDTHGKSRKAYPKMNEPWPKVKRLRSRIQGKRSSNITQKLLNL